MHLERADKNFDETGNFGGFPGRHFARRDCRHNRGIPGSYEKLEAVVDPNHPHHAEAKRFSPKFLLNDPVAPAERVISALALGSVSQGRPTDRQSKRLVWPEICLLTEASRRKLTCPTLMSSKFPAVLRELSPATPKITCARSCRMAGSSSEISSVSPTEGP